MPSYRKEFFIAPGNKVRLADIDAGYKGRHEDKASAQDETRRYSQQLGELQYLLYAEDKHSLLIVLQAPDAGGKDGTINHVLASMNPQGCSVRGFKAPSPEEASHDFLWRIYKATPTRGHVAVFNRSHYEDVLFVRVHKLVPKEIWSQRYDAINNFEKELTDNRTQVVKFYLHIDKDEQLTRFKQRLDDPHRQWKISESDYNEREYWDDYMRAYEDAISKCSTAYAPWYVIPANHKWFRNLAVSQILVETLQALNMSLPSPRVNLTEIRKKYHAAETEARTSHKDKRP